MLFVDSAPGAAAVATGRPNENPKSTSWTLRVLDKWGFNVSCCKLLLLICLSDARGRKLTLHRAGASAAILLALYTIISMKSVILVWIETYMKPFCAGLSPRRGGLSRFHTLEADGSQNGRRDRR